MASNVMARHQHYGTLTHAVSTAKEVGKVMTGSGLYIARTTAHFADFQDYKIAVMYLTKNAIGTCNKSHKEQIRRSLHHVFLATLFRSIHWNCCKVLISFVDTT